MPVIINSAAIHPFLPSLGTPLAIESARAEHQDIRPLEIAIINLMADKQTTERQLALWLGNTILQVKLTFATTDSYFRDVNAGRETKNTPAEHIRKFYSAWSEIKDRKFDGFIVHRRQRAEGTGERRGHLARGAADPATGPSTNVLSSLFLCWGAKAALKHFHDVESIQGQAEIVRPVRASPGVGQDRPAVRLPRRVLRPGLALEKPAARRHPEARGKLEIVADSEESGPNIMVESGPYDRGRFKYPRRVYILNHPEYDTETLGRRIQARRRGQRLAWPLPLHYLSEATIPARRRAQHLAPHRPHLHQLDQGAVRSDAVRHPGHSEDVLGLLGERRAAEIPRRRK